MYKYDIVFNVILILGDVKEDSVLIIFVVATKKRKASSQERDLHFCFREKNLYLLLNVFYGILL